MHKNRFLNEVINDKYREKYNNCILISEDNDLDCISITKKNNDRKVNIMNKQLLKRIITVLFLIFSFAQVMFLTSCQIEEVNLESMTLIEGPTDFVIGEFDYSKYSFLLTYKDGEKKTITLTEDMLSSEDYLKTYRDGEHTLTATYLNMKCEFTVTGKRYKFSESLDLEDAVVVYDGNTHGLEIVGDLPEGTTVTFPDGNAFVDHGTYTINAVLVNSLYETKKLQGKLVIEQAEFDASGIEFNDVEYVYDGNPKTITVSGNVPDDLTVTYYIGKAETNSMTDANEEGYVVTAKLNPGGNYKNVQELTAKLVIKKAVYDMSGVEFKDKTYTYDGNYKSLKVGNLTKLPKGVTVQYTNNEQKTVGVYEATATFIGDTTNYEAIPDMTATLTITPAKVNLSTVMLENESFVYDKGPHFVSYTGTLPKGVSFSKYEYYEIDDDNEEIQKVDAIIDVGRYKVKALFLYNDKINYDDIDPLECIVEITKAEITDAVFENTTFEYDGFSHSIYVSNLPDGVIATYTNNVQKEVGNYTVTVTFEFEPGSVADKNYNSLSSMSATMSITKATMGGNFDDVDLDYAGQAYTYVAQEYRGNNNVYLGQKIVIKCGDNEVDGQTIYEYLPEGVLINFTLIDPVTKVESTFTGITNPGEELLYIDYYTESAEVAASCYSHYNIESPTLTTITVNEQTKNVYLLSRKALVLKVNKKAYIPSFVNQLTEYTGSDITVEIDVNTDTTNGKYPNLSYASGYEVNGGVYTNNVQTNPGIYTGSVEIKLSEEASNYYTVQDSYEFIYAIKAAGGKTVYNPQIDDIIYDDYTTDKEVYTLPINVTIPEGMAINYVYGSDITKPGSYAVKVIVSFLVDDDPVVSYGDAAYYYYRLPTTYTESADKLSASKVITYTVRHMTYTPSFNVSYDYAGAPIVITGIDLPDWIEVKYYEGDKEISFAKLSDTDYVLEKPGTYHITAKSTIIDEEKAEYYEVDNNGVEFDLTINKGIYSGYKIVGQTWKYDGTLKNVTVTDLPDGVTYTTSLGEGRSEVGVYKDVIIYFENNSEYYQPLDNVKLTMTIENNSVSLGNLEAYVKTQGNKNVKQFSTLKGILGDYVDLTGADVEWRIDYYKNNVIYSDDYTNRHGTSETSTDFDFTESTADDEYAICTFTIKLRNGYVFDDDNQSTSYSGNLTMCVDQTKKVDLGSLVDISDRKEYHVSQDTVLENLIYSLAPQELDGSFEITSWSANYYSSLTPYPTEYAKAHADSTTSTSKFKFELNTWGERYCLVEYTLEILGDYCFYYNGQSYHTYSSSFKCLVDQNVVRVDDYFINQAITTDGFNALKYYSLDTYLGKLIDTNNVNLSAELYDNNNQKVEKDDNGLRLMSDANTASKIDLSISLRSGIEGFENSSATTITLTKANVLLDDPEILTLYDAFALARQKSEAHNFVFEQYVQPGNSYSGLPYMQYVMSHCYFSFEAVYPDGTPLSGFNNYIASLDKVTVDDEEATITWYFNAKDGYCVLDHETGERLETFEQIFNFKVIAVEKISTEEISEYASETHEVNQYSDIADEVQEYIDEMKAVAGTNLTYTWSAGYYDGTTKMSTGLSVTDSSEDLAGYLDLATTETQYFNLVLNFTTLNNSGYIFDTIQKNHQVVIRYTVKPRTVFTEDKLTEINDKLYIVKQNSTLQNLVNTFGLNSNISFDKWIIEYTDTEKVTKQGKPVNVYVFEQLATYHVTLKCLTADGTCMYENEKYIDNFTIEFDVKAVPAVTSVLNITNKVMDGEAINLGTQNVYEQDNILALVQSMFDNVNALETTIMYKVGTGEYVTLGSSDEFSTIETNKFTFKIMVKMSTNDIIYILNDGNGEKLAGYDDEDDEASGTIYISMNVNVQALTVVNFDAKTGSNAYSWNEAWNNYAIISGKSFNYYALYNISDYCTVTEAKVGNNNLTTARRDDPDYLTDLTRQAGGSGEYTITFTLEAKRGYVLDDSKATTKEFTFTDKLIQYTSTSFTTWNSSFDGTLQTYIEYDHALIGMTSLTLPLSTSDYNVSYKVTQYSLDGTTSNLLTDWTTSNDDITALSTYESVYNYVYTIEYKITTDGGSFGITDYWGVNEYESTISILNMTVNTGMVYYDGGLSEYCFINTDISLYRVTKPALFRSASYVVNKRSEDYASNSVIKSGSDLALMRFDSLMVDYVSYVYNFVPGSNVSNCDIYNLWEITVTDSTTSYNYRVWRLYE